MDLFENWLLSEGIFVQINGQDESLRVVEPSHIREFNYQSENNWSSFFIAPYQSQREGYISISNRPNFVGIIKTTPIEQKQGTDIAFIKSLIHELQGIKYQSVPYKNQGQPWWMTDHPDMQKLYSPEKDKQQYQQSQIPDFNAGSSNMSKVSSGISTSKDTGSWAYFIKSEYPDSTIKNILNAMKKAIQPMIDKDFVDFYEIVERTSGKRIETSYSKKGQETQNSHESQYKQNVAYLKYLAMNFLQDYPHAQKLVLNRINGTGVTVSGGGEHPAKKITPEKYQTSFDTLQKFIDQSYAEDITLKTFVQGIAKEGKMFYHLLDIAGGSTKEDKHINHKGAIVDAAIDMLNSTGYTKLGMDILPDTNQDSLLYSLSAPLKIFKYSKEMKEIHETAYNKFTSIWEKAINDKLDKAIEDNENKLSASDIKHLKQLSEFIDIKPEYLTQINDLHNNINKQEKEQLERRQKEQEDNQNLLDYNEAKYLTLDGDTKSWTKIQSKYLDYDGEVNIGEFARNEIVDSEDVLYKAHEIAQEEAYEDAETKKSLTYGEDKSEVESDIEIDFDDFLNDEEIDEDLDNLSDDNIIKLIKEKYFDEFMQWKKEELEKEEEQESWKYEPEPESQRIYEIEEELSGDIAYDDYGLLIAQRNDKGEVEFIFNSKFKEKAIPLIRTMLSLNLKKKHYEDQEPYVKNHTKVLLNYTDKNAEITSVYNLIK